MSANKWGTAVRGNARESKLLFFRGLGWLAEPVHPVEGVTLGGHLSRKSVISGKVPLLMIYNQKQQKNLSEPSNIA